MDRKLDLADHNNYMESAMDIDWAETNPTSNADMHTGDIDDSDAKSCKSARKHLLDADQATSTTAPNKRTFDNESYADTYLRESKRLPLSEPTHPHRPSFNDQTASRRGYLDDIAETSRLKHRAQLQQPGQKHNRPDGFTRHPAPPDDAIGRRDKMGTLVPLLTLTTPADDDDDNPRAGMTCYLHDGNQWPAVRGDRAHWWMQFDKSLVVTREEYDRRGAERTAQRGCEAYASLLKGVAVGGISSSSSSAQSTYRRNPLDSSGAGLAASNGKRTAICNLGQPKQVKLPARGNYSTPYEEEDSDDV